MSAAYCRAAPGHPVHGPYHDDDYGFPARDDRVLFERLVLEINQAVFFDTNPIPIKYMMRRLGLLPTNEHRLPNVPATPELEKRLDNVLRRAGLLQDRAA